MIRILLLVLLTLLIVRSLRMLLRGIVTGATNSDSRSPASVKLVKDPVCGTHVTPRSHLSVTSRGSTYYFCSEQCRDRFQKR